MAVLSLPLSFNNSFWSQEYRKGLEVLFAKLEQGIAENEEIVAFIMARAVAEGQLAAALLDPVQPDDTGFGADDGASLLVTFRGLQAESVAQGSVHKSIAQELKTLVAGPFDEWAEVHKKRLVDRKRAFFDVYIPSYEEAQAEVAKLKSQYLSKVRKADEAEDDAKFAPTTQLGDTYTSSPKLRPHDRAPPQRTASVSDRIAQRLREIQNKSMGTPPTTIVEEAKSSPETAPEPLPKPDKGKGKALDTTPPRAISPLPMLSSPKVSAAPLPPPMIFAGLAFTPSGVSQLLTRAAREMPLRPIRVPVMGEYPDCFTGEEFVAWLRDNVEGLGGSLDLAEDAARDMTERDSLLRRIGEFGNQFELSEDAFYQFRTKAFELGRRTDSGGILDSPKATLAPAGESFLKRTGTFVNMVSKVMNAPTEPAYIRAREDAKVADHAYRGAVRNLDRQRLVLEDRIEDTLKTLQAWEAERLGAVKTVLLQYQGTLSNIPKYFVPSIERSATLTATYQPETDLTALMERYRTGPFRPEAHVYESVSQSGFDVAFGIDLRKWAEGGWSTLMSENVKKDLLPPVFASLLAGLEAAYPKLAGDSEKRKCWIYEVPLPAVHHLREALNALPLDQPAPAELLAQYDAPIIASTIKLWLLELNPPLALWEGWEEFRKIYPHVGSTPKTGDADPEDQHLQDLKNALLRLPLVHLHVLDSLLQHLRTLIDTTDVEETNEVYIAKLSLSLGRTIIRPRFESEIAIQDRHPTLLFIDLLKNYAEVVPPTIARKKRESERRIPVPVKKRTALVDVRVHRSKISGDADPRQLLVAQQVAQNPSLAKRPVSPPPAVSAAGIEEQLLNRPPPPIPVAEPRRPVFQEPEPESEDLPARPVFNEPAAPPAHHASKEPPAENAGLPPPQVFTEPSPEGIILPPRPTFKEPPPEDVVLPPRPAFKEPPPEDEDLAPRPTVIEPPHVVEPPPRPTFKEEVDDLLPRPTFKEPPPEVEAEAPAPPTVVTDAPKDVAAPAPALAVVPPTPKRQVRPTSGSFSSRNGSPSPPKGSRTSSPAPESGTSPASTSPLSRAWGAATGSSSLVRGPRLAAKGPRGPGEGSVRGMVASMNRNSVVAPSPAAASPTPAPVKRLSSPSPRSSLMFGRSGSLSRRTMASDAEDNVVDRK